MVVGLFPVGQFAQSLCVDVVLEVEHFLLGTFLVTLILLLFLLLLFLFLYFFRFFLFFVLRGLNLELQGVRIDELDRLYRQVLSIIRILRDPGEFCGDPVVVDFVCMR